MDLIPELKAQIARLREQKEGHAAASQQAQGALNLACYLLEQAERDMDSKPQEAEQG